MIAREGRPVVEIRAIEPVSDTLIGSVSVRPGVDLTEPVIEPEDLAVLG